MWDVDLRTKTTSLHNDSWSLADTPGACRHFLDKASQCLTYTKRAHIEFLA